jgi:tripartite-type tricarboxylate transporter receptor subunit TctC
MLGKIGSMFLVLLPILLMGFGEIARAADFPTKSIELIIPFAPGGPSDAMGRAVAPKMGEVLGQTIVPVNKPGASGALALTLLTKIKPDGYTILIASASHLIVVPNFEKVAYNTLTDFTFLGKLVNQTVTMLVVKADAPWKTAEEFFDYAKKNPKKIKYGTPGQFHGGHIFMEALGREKGIDWVHIPFKGDGPCTIALLGGHIDAGIIYTGHIAHVRAGKLRGLATLRTQRSRTFPDIPCLPEVGSKMEGKGLTESMNGLIGPKGMPADMVKKYEAAIEQATKSPEFLRACRTMDLEPHYLPGEEYRKETESGYKYVSDLGTKLGFR